MVNQDFGSSPAPVEPPPILTNNTNNTNNNNQIPNIKISPSLVKLVTNVVGKEKGEGFTSNSICNQWSFEFNKIKDNTEKNSAYSAICNMDPDIFISNLNMMGDGGLTVDMLPRKNDCSVCKDLDTCKNNIKDIMRPNLQPLCDSEEKLKEVVENNGLNTDIYTYDYVCKKEFDPCYVPVADGSNTDLDSAPITTLEPKPDTEPKPKPEPTKKYVDEIDSEDTPEDNSFQIMIFLLLLLLIIASIVYQNLFK